MTAEEVKKFDLAVMNVRAKLVRGQLGESPMWKKAADSYAALFTCHHQLNNIGKEIQRLAGEQEKIAASINKMAGGMEVMEGVLAEELLASGVELEDLDMTKLTKIAQEAAGIKEVSKV